nr:hypothetical protein [Alcaligenes faecalis]
MKTRLKNLWVQAGQALTWKNLKDSRYWLAAFWLTYLPMWWFFGNPYLAGLAALSSLCGAARLHSHYMRTLATRIEAKDGFSWDVAVNQVKVGSILDADYALVRHRVFSDVRVYVAQVLNLLRVALNSFDYCFRAIPLGTFWIGVVLAIFSPETISSVLAALQGATADSIKHAVPVAGLLLAVMMILSVLFHWMFGLSRFGFINCFDEAVGTAIRKHCGVAAEGSITLSRWVPASSQA